jgi:hypothetical protein
LLAPQVPARLPVPEVAPEKVPPSAGMSATPWQAVQPLPRFPPTQTPRLQMSLVVQVLPSVQGRLLLACRQPSVAPQMSSVQGLPSSQFSGVPGVQTPARQVSSPLHNVASAHEVPSGLATFVQARLTHASAVQGLASSQSASVTHAAAGVAARRKPRTTGSAARPARPERSGTDFEGRPAVRMSAPPGTGPHTALTVVPNNAYRSAMIGSSILVMTPRGRR